MAGSLLSAAFVLCVYMISVGYLLMNNHWARSLKGGNLTPLVLLAQLLFFINRDAWDSDQRREAAQGMGGKIFGAGLSCGIVTLVVALLMPQLSAAVIMFVVVWGTFLYTVIVLFKGWNKRNG